MASRRGHGGTATLPQKKQVTELKGRGKRGGWVAAAMHKGSVTGAPRLLPLGAGTYGAERHQPPRS